LAAFSYRIAAVGMVAIVLLLLLVVVQAVGVRVIVSSALLRGGSWIVRASFVLPVAQEAAASLIPP